jgi:hypothetical protein
MISIIKAIGKWLKDNSDTILRLTGTLAIAGGAWFAHSYESKLTSLTLISEREQSQSQLRINMFSNLITPFSGPSREKEIDPHRERVLVELLALNFHEDFEFKPLMLHVDKRLSKACNPNHDGKKNGEKMISKEQAKEDRASLRSIARRVTSKQIKKLIKEGLPYPMEMLHFEVPIVKITDVKGLNNKLVEKKVVLKDSDGLLYFYHKSEIKLVEVLREKDFTGAEIKFVLNKFQESFIRQDPIKVKKEDFTDKELIDKLLEKRIVVKKDKEDYLFFYYETSDELENKLLENYFNDAEGTKKTGIFK